MNTNPDKNNENGYKNDANGGSNSGFDPMNLIRQLQPLFEAADVRPPENLGVRNVCILQSLHEQAFQLAGMLKGKNLLFRRGQELGTIVSNSGEWETMDADRLATWLPMSAGIHPVAGIDKKTGKPKTATFKADDMRRILRSDVLRNSVPEIVAINRVRLPVFRGKGEDQKIDWLPFGYDKETKIFTVKSLEYNVEPDVDEATQFLHDLLKYFPMGDRSRAVQVAAMLSVYCRALYNGRPPMFLLNGNLPGSGKSRLGDLILAPHGNAGKAGYHWRDGNEVRKELDATACELAPYILFDDVVLPKGMKLRNTDLNRWLTARIWEARQMHTQKKIRVPVGAVTIMTGTQLELDDHLGRSTLLVDLAAKQRAKDKVLPPDAIVLSDDFLEDDSIVRKVLEAMAALVGLWDEKGRPNFAGRPLESFESWSRIIPAIADLALFGDCLEIPDSFSGDVSNKEFDFLIRCLVRDFVREGETQAWISMTDIIRTGRLEGLFSSTLREIDQIVRQLNNTRSWEWEDAWIAMTTDDVPDSLREKPIYSWTCEEKQEFAISKEPDEEAKRFQAASWTDRSIETKWGCLFKSYAVVGQWYADEVGRFWVLEKRKRSSGVGYMIRLVSEEERDLNESQQP